MNEGKRKVVIESFSTPGVRYEIDLDRSTCTCPAFRKRPSERCKHLRSFDGLFVEAPSPDPNEALSAMIKSIRLRRTEDAVMWLLYLWRIPQFRGRAQRRLLIAAAEDNLSVGVIERVSDWYNTLERARFDSAVREIARICATPNWWAQPDGHAYIRAWVDAERKEPSFETWTEDALYLEAAKCSEGGDVQGALTAFTALYARTRVAPHRVAGLLNEISPRSRSRQAMKLTALYLRNIRAAGVDGNLSGQAFYAALVGRFGDQAVPEPSTDEVRDLVSAARRRLAENPRMPDWALDGIHTGRFRDPRFAGTAQRMWGCCRAYAHYGRLSVDDRWLPSFAERR